MSQYLLLWHLHVVTAAISVCLFVWRFLLDERGHEWRGGPLRVLPHINDTLLLAAAVGLCLVVGWRPWLHGWLGAKVLLLVAYILLAAAAFRQDSRIRARTFAAAALMVVCSMVLLAITKPAPA